MIARLLVFLAALLLALPSSAGVECPIEMALAEQLGAPGATAQTVSVIPYDASSTGAGLRVCWAPIAAKDILGTPFQSAPAGVTCGTADTSWTAAERVDLTMTSLTAATRYWYKIQCDAPDTWNPQNLWTDRDVETFQTIPTAGADSDFMFTVEADPHYGSHLGPSDEGYCQRHDVADGVGIAGILPGWRNLEVALAEMAAARGVFHANLGDFYQTDGKTLANTCPTHLMISPARGPSVPEFGLAKVLRDGELVEQIPGFPTRTWSGPDGGGGYVAKSIQTTGVDANVYNRALWRVWKINSLYNPIFRRAPLVFAWGNHDNPLFPIGNTAGDCSGAYLTDGQGTPVAPWTHMLNAWTAINRKPSTEYPPGSDAPAGSNDGYYYSFPAGKAEFWILNAFEASGGKGTSSSTAWDGTEQFPEKAGDWSLGATQYNWFAADFAASTAKWKFILLHHTVGGVDVRDVSASTCYWYGRGSWLATEGRYCDADTDNVNDGLPNEKPCVTDDSSLDGYNASQDTRPAGWVAENGACDAGVICKPTPYANRTANLIGDDTYGQKAIQAVLEANIDAGGANFALLGHDHLTVAGCKEKTDGCSDVWYITGGQPSGSFGDDDSAVPDWAQSGLFSIYYDGDGDGIPDYRTDGAPNPTPLDSQAYTIRKAGTQQRGFWKVYIADEGVRIDHQGVELTEFAGDFGQTVTSFAIGEQAINETDVDGTTGQDSESKQANPPTITGVDVDCDYATAPAPLEGTQSCRINISTAVASVIADGAWADASGLTCLDWMGYMLDTPNDTVNGIGTYNFRENGANVSGLRLYTNGLVLPGDYAWRLATRAASGGETGASLSPPFYHGRTYLYRMCAVGSTDTVSIYVDACDTDDDNCDGESDSTPGTKVSVPVWGAGTFWTDTLTASAPTAYTVDGYRFGGPASADQDALVDAIGACDHNPGAFKCGDGFE